jgi:hypothetical protein
MIPTTVIAPGTPSSSESSTFFLQKNMGEWTLGSLTAKSELIIFAFSWFVNVKARAAVAISTATKDEVDTFVSEWKLKGKHQGH